MLRPMDEPLDGRIFGAEQPCFGCGPQHPIGFRLRFEREDDQVVSRFMPEEQYQGPPGIMHGGLVMTLADEVADWAIIALLGKFGFTGSVQCKLKRPVRIGAEVEARASIIKDSRRIVDTRVTLRQGGLEAFQGDFRFVVLDKAGAESMLGKSLPEGWERFCR
jgi:acyl-coenzyme A thioesterase PaaI-like protein